MSNRLTMLIQPILFFFYNLESSEKKRYVYSLLFTVMVLLVGLQGYSFNLVATYFTQALAARKIYIDAMQTVDKKRFLDSKQTKLEQAQEQHKKFPTLRAALEETARTCGITLSAESISALPTTVLPYVAGFEEEQVRLTVNAISTEQFVKFLSEIEKLFVIMIRELQVDRQADLLSLNMVVGMHRKITST